MKTPNEALQYHVTGAIERGEKQAIVAVIAKPHKLVTKYTQLIKSNRMTKVEIDSMRKALGMCSSLSNADKQQILDAFWAQVDKSGGIKITKEHAKQGLSYLTQLAFTSTGKMRNTKDYPFGDRECDVIRNFKEFRLTGLMELFNGMGQVLAYAAVWEVRGGSHPQSFEYAQLGRWMGIEIVR